VRRGTGLTFAMQRRTWLLRWALATAILASGCSSAPPAATREALAPTGTLRVAVYAGSPTSMVRHPGSGEMRGLAVDLGRELGSRLAVPVAIVEFPRVADVVAALKAGGADMTITNATAERAREVDFTAPLVALELGVLVRPGSPIDAVEAIDRPGHRIGVSQGSTSERVLGARLRSATLVAAPSLAAAGDMLRAGSIDAFATNKAILFELADRVPGARVLDGRWGLEHLAVAVPKGREAGREFLHTFVVAMQTDGQVQRAAERAGLRGSAPAESR
jgi:polar amino acid transport system substrate-binding protein